MLVEKPEGMLCLSWCHTSAMLMSAVQCRLSKVLNTCQCCRFQQRLQVLITSENLTTNKYPCPFDLDQGLELLCQLANNWSVVILLFLLFLDNCLSALWEVGGLVGIWSSALWNVSWPGNWIVMDSHGILLNSIESSCWRAICFVPSNIGRGEVLCALCGAGGQESWITAMGRGCKSERDQSWRAQRNERRLTSYLKIIDTNIIPRTMICHLICLLSLPP